MSVAVFQCWGPRGKGVRLGRRKFFETELTSAMLGPPVGDDPSLRSLAEWNVVVGFSGAGEGDVSTHSLQRSTRLSARAALQVDLTLHRSPTVLADSP